MPITPQGVNRLESPLNFYYESEITIGLKAGHRRGSQMFNTTVERRVAIGR